MKTIVLFALLALSSTMALCQNLTLEVKGFEKPEGHLYVALYSSKDDFLKKPAAAFRVDVKSETLSIPCQGLPAGMYAISMYHDANGNGILDTGAYGRPLEKTGFSRDAEGVMGPPSFEKCCFELKNDTTLVIHLK